MDKPLLSDIDFDRFVKEAVDPDFLRQITHISEFTYSAQTNFLGGWAEDKERRVIFRLQRSLQDALRLSGFHNQVELETRRSPDGVEFRYNDPDYEFTYLVDGRGRIGLYRRGSTLRRFHEWYRRFMPSLPSIVLEAVETLDEELTGFSDEEKDQDRRAKRDAVIRVERASYNFGLVVAISSSRKSDLNAEGVTNIQVLNRSLLRRVPSEDGVLTDPLTLAPDDFGRMTYQVNRWIRPNHALESYRVSGPSNNEWRNLYFDFAYAGETYVPSAGERRPLEQETFVTGASTMDAYITFFRNKAICGFVRGVLQGENGQGSSEDAPPPTLDATFTTRAES